MSESVRRDMHSPSIDEVLKHMESGKNGLSPDEAQQRLARYGANELTEPNHRSLLCGLIPHFTHFLAVLLWFAAGLAFIADRLKPGEGMATLGWAILAVIGINAFFAFFQEYKAERAVHALHRLLPTKAWVTRGGQFLEIPRNTIVPGDILLLDEGGRVPADARLIEAHNLRVDNAALTGESQPKRRTADSVDDEHWLDLANLVFAGTTILSGNGRAVVFATGMKTEFGKIASITAGVETGLSPLQKEIIKVTRIVAVLSLAMGMMFFTIGLATGLGFWVSAIFGIGIIVANVPEGLLPTVTLALAMGSQRMAKRNALIKHLPSVETLGCTTVICTDKTGTLTENRMKVECFYIDDLVIEAREGCFFTRGRVVSTTDAERWQSFFDCPAPLPQCETRAASGRTVRHHR